MRYIRLSSHRLLVLLFLAVSVQALYRIDDTNSSIQYMGTKWSAVKPNSQPWVENGKVYLSSLMQSSCETADNCHVLIPFIGSGITIYNVVRSSINVSTAVDGGFITTYTFTDDRSCLNDTSSGCFNTSIYDLQFLEYGNHTADIVISTVPTSATNIRSSDFYFDYAVINDTAIGVASPSPIFPPTTPIAPSNPTSSPITISSSTSTLSPTLSDTPGRNPGKPKNPGIIAGCVVGLLLLIPMLLFIGFCFVRRTWPWTFIRKCCSNRRNTAPGTSDPAEPSMEAIGVPLFSERTTAPSSSCGSAPPQLTVDFRGDGSIDVGTQNATPASVGSPSTTTLNVSSI